MINDNLPPEKKIVEFKPREIKAEEGTRLSVSLKSNMIGVEIEHGALLLTPEATLNLVLILLTAIKAHNEINKGN